MIGCIYVANWLHLRCVNIADLVLDIPQSTSLNYRRQEPSGVAIEAILVLFAAFVLAATQSLVNLLLLSRSVLLD
jgi:hypothetical protein